MRLLKFLWKDCKLLRCGGKGIIKEAVNTKWGSDIFIKIQSRII